MKPYRVNSSVCYDPLKHADTIKDCFEHYTTARNAIKDHGWDQTDILYMVQQLVYNIHKQIKSKKSIRGVWIIMVDKLPKKGQQLAPRAMFHRFGEKSLEENLNIEIDQELDLNCNYDQQFAFCFIETSTKKMFALPLFYPLY